MKIKYALLAILLITITFSCKNDDDCDNQNPVCSEVAPTNEACLAYFSRWFYNKNTNSCDSISYSGCSQKGFATKDECESCKCD